MNSLHSNELQQQVSPINYNNPVGTNFAPLKCLARIEELLTQDEARPLSMRMKLYSHSDSGNLPIVIQIHVNTYYIIKPIVTMIF